MEPDPDTYPTAEEDWHPDDDDTDAPEGDEEWRPGTCDNCTGHAGGQDEIRAAMASALIPVCACAIGQGAAAGQCTCGPIPFETEQLPDNLTEIVDELSRPIVSDNGTVIPPAMAAEVPAEVQPQTAADATARPDWWTDYVNRKTDEFMAAMVDKGFAPAADVLPELHADLRAVVARKVNRIMEEMAVHLTVPHA